MLRQGAAFIDSLRIWHKVTFQRGRILKTHGPAWEAYDRPEHYADPRGFYPCDGRVPDLTITGKAAGPRADVTFFRFPTLHRIEAGEYEETNTATGRLYRPRTGSDTPTVVLSHGWAHDGFRAIEAIYIEPLLKAGYAVAIVSHPFHFERAPAGTYSGELMVSGDVVLTVEAFRQAVADLCGLINWLRTGGRSTGPLGLIGYSLGGYIAGLVACVREDLDFVVLAATGASVVSPILDTGLGVNVREDLSWSGMDQRPKLERAWGMISPGRLALRVPEERILLLAGAWDRIMLPASVRKLRERWGRPAIQWENQGHYTLLAVPGRVVRKSLPFIQENARR